MQSEYRARRVAAELARGTAASAIRRVDWDRPVRGVLRPSGIAAEDPADDRVGLAMALLTEHCVLGGWASLRLQGNSWFDGRDRSGDLRRALVHCEPGSRLRRRDEVEPFRGLLHPDEWSVYDGVPMTSLARATFDEMRVAASVREAVVALDMAVSTTHDAPRTSINAVERVEASHHKVKGIVRVRKAIALASSRSASPWETRTRLVAQLDAGIPGLLVNAPVFDPAGRLLGVADLLDPASGLVIESDGAQHRDAEVHAADNRREEAFERAGLTVVRVSALDHAERWPLVRRINAAHLDALGSDRRRWTLETPAWWATSTTGRKWSRPR